MWHSDQDSLFLCQACIQLNSCRAGSVRTAWSRTAGCTLVLLQTQAEVVGRFKEGKYNLLIATNIGSEGMDFKQCQLVVAFEHPQTSPATYRWGGKPLLITVNSDWPSMRVHLACGRSSIKGLGLTNS